MNKTASSEGTNLISKGIEIWVQFWYNLINPGLISSLIEWRMYI